MIEVAEQDQDYSPDGKPSSPPPPLPAPIILPSAPLLPPEQQQQAAYQQQMLQQLQYQQYHQLLQQQQQLLLAQPPLYQQYILSHLQQQQQQQPQPQQQLSIPAVQVPVPMIDPPPKAKAAATTAKINKGSHHHHHHHHKKSHHGPGGVNEEPHADEGGGFDDDSDGTDSVHSSDSSSGGEDGDGSSKLNDMFPDPLSLIDKTVDLDKVVKAKSIGDAVLLLCPNMPGLPSKARGKYQKRKNLTAEEKADILRARNRDNARRTRKRKKMYMVYIDKLLQALETELGDAYVEEEEVNDDDDDDEDVEYTRQAIIMKRDRAAAQQQQQQQQQQQDVMVPPHRRVLESHLDCFRDFLRMHLTFRAEGDVQRASDWLKVCHTSAVHSKVGNDAFVATAVTASMLQSSSSATSSSSTAKDKGYACQGVQAIDAESSSVARYFDDLESTYRGERVACWSAPTESQHQHQREPTWFVQCSLKSSEAFLEGIDLPLVPDNAAPVATAASKLCVTYDLQVLCTERSTPTPVPAGVVPMAYYTDADVGNSGQIDRDYDSSIESDEGDALDYFGCFDALGGYGSDGGGGTPKSIKPFATANPRVTNGELLLFGISNGVDEEPIEDWIASMLANPTSDTNIKGNADNTERSSVRSSVSSISNVPGRICETAVPSQVAMVKLDGADAFDNRYGPAFPLAAAASSSSSRLPSRSQRFIWLNPSAGHGEGLANASVRLHSLLNLHVCAHVEYCPIAMENGIFRIIRVTEHVEKIADWTEDNHGGNNNLGCL